MRVVTDCHFSKLRNLKKELILRSELIRNVAIIAHVDHGKTTLVDNMMQICNIFRQGQKVQECFLDSNDQERERGITILSKNIALNYKNTKINIIDTPGHADFSGEVERVMGLADGALLLVDSHEGVMPQTRFVLKKALQAGLVPIVIINKMDRPDKRPEEALNSVYELFLELNVSDYQLDFPVLYASGKSGWASYEVNKIGKDIIPLLDTIIKHVPSPKLNDGPLQMQISSFEYSDYVGRIGIGRVYRGKIIPNKPYLLVNNSGKSLNVTLKQIYEFTGLGRKEVQEVHNGDLCAVIGIEEVDIGDTITDVDHPEALKSLEVDDPTISMRFSVNDSPFYGQDGKYVTSRHLGAYLQKVLKKDVSVLVEKTELEGSFRVFGRGILHFSVLIENMRRDGYELSVGQPQVVLKEIGGKTCEPVETLTIEVSESYAGKVIEAVAQRKGELQNIDYTSEGQCQTFIISSRGIIGLRSQLLNSCSGNIVMHHRFLEYRQVKGIPDRRVNGSIISMDTGAIVPYALANLQDRGTFFTEPGDRAYQGMVVGEHCKSGDIVVNVQKEKKQSNMRASGRDKELRIAPSKKLSLEEALEFISEDELVEITPLTFRIRKKILDPQKRKRNQF